jgi:predicted nucleic acid-binding protein
MNDQAPVFIAADALVARHLAADPQHPQARQVWLWLAAERPPLITIPAVLDAAASQLAQRADPEFAAERARRWANSRALQVVVPTADDHHAALGWLERYRDPGANLADCWAWAVMSRLRISRAFTFREPFRWAGHVLLPSTLHP